MQGTGPPPSERNSPERVAKESSGGNYCHSFRPFLWVWAPDEERAVWQTAFHVMLRMATSALRLDVELQDLAALGIGDHKASTRLVFVENFPNARFLQCYTHVWRNIVERLSKFQGKRQEQRAQATWMKNQVRKLAFACLLFFLMLVSCRWTSAI